MVKFRFLSGKMAGHSIEASHFPFTLGRSAKMDFRMEEPGVWDEHAELRLEANDTFALTLKAGAKGSLNGQPVEKAILRNGDTLELGGAKLQFYLAETQLKDWSWPERLLWSFVGFVVVSQILLFYWIS